MKVSFLSSEAFRAAACLLVLFGCTPRMHGAFYPSSFAHWTPVYSSAGQIAMAMGDLDGDGKLDVVAGGTGVGVYHNVGTPGVIDFTTFEARVDLTSGNPTQIRLADLDGDGRMDIVSLNQADRTVSVMRNTATFGVINANSFAVQVLPSLPFQPTSVAIADFDGDGRPDIAVSTSSYFFLFKNTSSPGAMTFGSAVYQSLSTSAFNIEAGDIDGDGKPDLVAGITGTSEFWVFRNVYSSGPLTNNTFANPFYFPGVYGAVTLGDIDGDGKLDVVTANALGNTISLWRNTATPGTIFYDSFAPRLDFPTAAYPYRVVLGDLDGDGRPDIVTANSDSASVSVFQNISAPGAMILAPRADYATGLNPRICVIGDIDGDGRRDIACATLQQPSFSVLKQLPPPPPPPKPQITTNPVPTAVLYGSVATFAVSATGTNLSHRWLFKGTPVFAAVLPSLTLSNITFANGGDYAAVVSNEGGSVTSVLARLTVIAPPPPQITTHPASQTVPLGTTVNFAAAAIGINLTYQWYFQGLPKSGATTPTFTVTNAMLSHAGAYTIVVANGGGNVTSTVATLTVQLDPSYETHVDFPASTILPGIDLGDVDGDGKPDAIVANYVFNLGGVSVYRNVSIPGILDTNSFAPFVSYPVGAEPVQNFLADLDRDGKPDIVCVCQNGLEISVLRNTSTPGVIDSNSFAPRISLGAIDRPSWAAAADLNGDGKLELIVVTYYNTRALTVFENTSTPGRISFAQRAFIAPNADSISVEAGDIDGDGKPDIVACSRSTPFVWVFRNIHAGGPIIDGSFAVRVSFPTANAASVKLADMDGDGKLDIVLVSASENIASVLRNTSTPGVIDANSFAAPVNFPAGLYPYRPAIADLNGDGRPDVIVANAAGDTVSVFMNNANPGSFTTASLAPRLDYPTGPGPRVVAVADIDGDGQLDLATADFSQTAFSVLRHAGPHPSVLRTPTLLEGGLFSFQFDAEVRTNYTVDGSVDLLHWIPLTNFLDASGLIQFIEPAAPGRPGRFYRIRTSPQ